MVAATKKGAKTLERELKARFSDVERTAMRGGFRVYRASNSVRPEPVVGEDDA